MRRSQIKNIACNVDLIIFKVEDEIRKTQRMNINVSDYFVGDRWRVHPGWVYCRFHYAEGHEFSDPESEIRHFLKLLGEDDWKWSDQYQAYTTETEENFDELDCGHRSLQDDDYYCNQELMELLVFDAKATNSSYAGEFSHWSRASRELSDDWGLFLRFVATQSGLTRWQPVDDTKRPSGKDSMEFGDLHRRAVNEPWYKGAIFQHEIEHDSLSVTGISCFRV